MSRARILMVDDEPIVREVVERYLAREGYAVQSAGDGASALRLARATPPDLVVLDLMLPEVDGLEVCRRLRDEGGVPIIMLTARGDELDKIVGFGLGADDYIVKPFSPRELLARIAAVLRRSRAATDGEPPSAPPLRFAGLTVDPAGRRVEVDGRPVELTPREFDLLHFLARHPGQVFSREQLLDHVWGDGFAGEAATVTVHIRRLRGKIEPDATRPRRLATVWGIGYRFEA